MLIITNFSLLSFCSLQCSFDPQSFCVMANILNVLFLENLQGISNLISSESNSNGRLETLDLIFRLNSYVTLIFLVVSSCLLQVEQVTCQFETQAVFPFLSIINCKVALSEEQRHSPQSLKNGFVSCQTSFVGQAFGKTVLVRA